MPTPTIPNALEELKALVTEWRSERKQRTFPLRRRFRGAIELSADIHEKHADALDALLPRLAVSLESAILERERTEVARGVQAVKAAVQSRQWLTEGRGPYGWDDDRWHQEFAAAAKEILDALIPLGRIGADFSNCPKAPLLLEVARHPVGLTFHEAMQAAQCGLDEWKEKPHNKKWWKRLDGTPIPNDLLVCIATQMQNAALHASATASADKLGSSGINSTEADAKGGNLNPVPCRQQGVDDPFSRSCERCHEVDVDGGGVWVSKPDGLNEELLCGGCVSKELNTLRPTADSDRAKLERLIRFVWDHQEYPPGTIHNLLAAFEASESERGKVAKANEK